MARWTIVAGSSVLLGLMLSSCTSSAVECDCVDAALTVSIPDDRAADVESVTASGPACTNVVASCKTMGGSGACDVYRVAPNATGACYIAIVFSSGAAMFSSETEIVEGAACCGGYVASPPSGGDIVVPDDTTGGDE